MKRSTFLRNILALSFVLDAAIASSASAKAASGSENKQDTLIDLAVQITEIRNGRGNIVVALFHGPDGFPDNGEKAQEHRIVPSPTDGTLTIKFSRLAPGEYAISLFHDENENGEMDTSFGFPLEGFGVSNNPKLHWGAPRYKECKISLSPDHPEMKTTIKMSYLTDETSDSH